LGPVSLLPAASFAEQAIMRTIVLVAIAPAGMSCAHKSMNAGQSAEEPFAPKRGATKIALKLSPPRRACGRFLSPMRHRQRALAPSRVAQRRFEAVRTAILEGQAERPAAGLNHCFPSLLPHSASASRFTANALEFSILSQSGERPERWAEFFINTTLSKLEHNSDRRPAADAKSGPEETSAPSRDRSQWLA
jgi:hypothetical protein